jgi:hypothetical protein
VNVVFGSDVWTLQYLQVHVMNVSMSPTANITIGYNGGLYLYSDCGVVDWRIGREMLISITILVLFGSPLMTILRVSFNFFTTQSLLRMQSISPQKLERRYAMVHECLQQ